ncbi:hypothetical protein H1C71_021089, partial [Ictidomys tridecemlineatus]
DDLAALKTSATPKPQERTQPARKMGGSQSHPVQRTQRERGTEEPQCHATDQQQAPDCRVRQPLPPQREDLKTERGLKDSAVDSSLARGGVPRQSGHSAQRSH